MPVNGFSFLSEKFFLLPFDVHPVELARWRLRGKNQKRRCMARRSIQNAAEGTGRNCLVQDGCRVLRYALRIVRENPRHVVVVENSARSFLIVRTKQTRA